MLQTVGWDTVVRLCCSGTASPLLGWNIPTNRTSRGEILPQARNRLWLRGRKNNWYGMGRTFDRSPLSTAPYQSWHPVHHYTSKVAGRYILGPKLQSCLNLVGIFIAFSRIWFELGIKSLSISCTNRGGIVRLNLPEVGSISFRISVKICPTPQLFVQKH